MAKLHRDLNDIPGVRPNDPEYRAVKEAMGKDVVYGYDKHFPHENIKIHNVKSRPCATPTKIPTVVGHDHSRRKVVRLTRYQNICYRAYKTLKKRHNHITKEILVAYSSAATVKALIRADILEEYTQKGQCCIRAKSRPVDLSNRVGSIVIRMPS